MGELDQREVEDAALRYLEAQLGDRAPEHVRFEGEFDEQPLDGEGATAVFSFDLRPGPGVESGTCRTPAQRKHYVAVGHTEPNYFPAYGLGADDAYSLHLGTRFMLEMGLQLVDAALEPPGARALLHAAVQNFGGGAKPEAEHLAALFRCEEGVFAVYRLTVEGRDVYCIGADCPPGFYSLTEYPPQVALRLHLGKLIRAEASRGRSGGA